MKIIAKYLSCIYNVVEVKYMYDTFLEPLGPNTLIETTQRYHYPYLDDHYPKIHGKILPFKQQQKYVLWWKMLYKPTMYSELC